MSSPTQPVPSAPLSEKRIEELRWLYRPGGYKSDDINGLLAALADRDKRLAAVIALCDEPRARIKGIVATDSVRDAAEGRTP